MYVNLQPLSTAHSLENQPVIRTANMKEETANKYDAWSWTTFHLYWLLSCDGGGGREGRQWLEVFWRPHGKGPHHSL